MSLVVKKAKLPRMGQDFHKPRIYPGVAAYSTKSHRRNAKSMAFGGLTNYWSEYMTKTSSPLTVPWLLHGLRLFLAGIILFSWQNLSFSQEDTDAKPLQIDRSVHWKPYLAGKPFKNITLEMSLKPFRKNDPEAIRGVCREVFTQWSALLRHADMVSIMLWTADGSEILDYSGNLSQRLEWGQYIGNPNSGRPVNSGPKNLTTHERAFDYMEHPPEFTYHDLKFIVRTLKEVGRELTGKPVRVGETFDPGPEFAKSPFKYEKHPEICLGGSMGNKSMVTCYSVLKKDDGQYAGFPNGIPEGTPFGTFFGRQSQFFLTDMGFDFLWFSNGFGFGLETWHATGVIFDGKVFHRDNVFETRTKIIEFWKLFRNECPKIRVETRGTNQTTGADIAADGVDLRGIYQGNFNMMPPPNSPWAALNGDFGFELTGYMSRIVETPDDNYMFRYYTHDPWWHNSPWLDRYGREPHDIYLPMAVARIDADGKIALPTHLNFLTIDDSFGNMPTQVPNEVTPHILAARYHSPDQPGVTVWVYPFDEYHDWADTQPERLEEIFFGDWFIRQAINEGFPLNTVVSSKAFVASQEKHPDLYDESILVSVVPSPDSRFETALMKFVHDGGRLIVYGPITHASRMFREMLGITAIEPLEGEFECSSLFRHDILTQKTGPMKMVHRSLFCGGGIETQAVDAENVNVLISAKQANEVRDVVVARTDPKWNGGKTVYVRGTNSVTFPGGHLLVRDNPELHLIGGTFMRLVLQEFGYSIQFEKRLPGANNPITCIARCDNGFFFSSYVPNTMVKQKFQFPQGAPLLLGYETVLEDGCSTYFFPRAQHRECRIFVQQPESSDTISCIERTSEELEIIRRIQVTGLKNADVYVYPDKHIMKDRLNAYVNADRPWRTGKVEVETAPSEFGHCFVIRNITGKLVVSW